MNYLGYSWVDRGEHLDEAFKMLRQAVALRPEDGYVIDSLGWAHFKLGEYDEAVKELERAIELKPSDPTINDHLGDAIGVSGANSKRSSSGTMRATCSLSPRICLPSSARSTRACRISSARNGLRPEERGLILEGRRPESTCIPSDRVIALCFDDSKPFLPTVVHEITHLPIASPRSRPDMSAESAVVTADDDGMRLDRWFKRHHPGLTLGHLNKIVRTGQVRVDGGASQDFDARPGGPADPDTASSPGGRGGAGGQASHALRGGPSRH